MALDAPDRAGSYLLVVDVLLPDGESFAANGIPPGLIRVSVEAEPSTVAQPKPDPRVAR